MCTIPRALGVSQRPGGGRAGEGQGEGFCREFPQTAAECLFFLFFFLINSYYSSLPLQTSAWPLTQPHSNQTGGQTGSGSITAQLFPAGVHSLSGCPPPLCVCHFVLIPHCDFKHPGPSWCCSNFVWQGREPLTCLSQESCGRPCRCRA